MRAYWAVSLALISGFCLHGCAAPIAAISASGTAAASSAGTSAVAVAAANPVTTTSMASTVATGKSPLEHAVSAATKKECSFTNIVTPKPICEDVVMPKIIDKSTPLAGPADPPKDTIKK